MLASLPDLHNGDRMTREEFLRRWEKVPELKHAELIKGVVYLGSSVSIAHGSYHALFGAWLGHYAYTVGQNFEIMSNTTLPFGDSSFQPDVAMLAQRQGRTGTTYLEELPDLVVEISYSSQSYDLGPKLAADRSAGLREYITVLLQEQRVEWRVLSGTRCRLLHSGKDGICVPRTSKDCGWLDTGALFPTADRQRLFAAIDRGLAQ